jgi:hypothetical protein
MQSAPLPPPDLPPPLRFAGASAGGIAAVLAAAGGFDAERALAVAWRLCEEQGLVGQ